MNTKRPKLWYDQAGYATRRTPRTAVELQLYLNSTGEAWAVEDVPKKEPIPLKVNADGSIDMSAFDNAKAFAEKKPVDTTLKRLVYEDYPTCCGAVILSSFPYDYDYDYDTEDIKAGKADVPRAIARAKIERRGQIIAITNNSQMKMGKFLGESGFKKISVVNNPVHNEDTVITTWMFTIANKAEIVANT